MIKIKAVQDSDCHWYILPNDMVEDFYKDEQNSDFDNKYSKYRTGGDLNLIQLYAKL